MPFDVPTLPTLIQRAVSDLAGSASDALRRSDAQVLARVHSGAAHLGYGYLKWISKQLFPDECDEDMLIRQANLRLRDGRKAAQEATGLVGVTGQPRAPIGADALLQTADQIQYRTTADTELDANGIGAVSVRAVVPGKAGNLDGGTRLTFVSPVDGVSSDAVVSAAGIRGGSEIESIDELRKRVKASYRRTPMGGNGDDYEDWALEVPGVTRAWVRRRYMGPGTVAVFVMRDDDDDPFPGEVEIAAATAHIEAQRPLGAELYVLAPVDRPVKYRIRLSPDTATTRAAVIASLKDLHAREADLGVTFLHSHIDEAISTTAGETDHDLVEPTASVELAVNELPTFGGVAWVM
ncbi:Baseplate J/gp47 family protein [Burkholderia multivorans]